MPTRPDDGHFVVFATDAADSAARRDSSLEDHRKHVDLWAGHIVLSGPLVADDSVARVGQVYVVRADDRAEVERFVEQDPFTRAGVFADVQIYRFLPKFHSGQRL